jgi:hypothetical protein
MWSSLNTLILRIANLSCTRRRCYIRRCTNGSFDVSRAEPRVGITKAKIKVKQCKTENCAMRMSKSDDVGVVLLCTKYIFELFRAKFAKES